MRFLAFLNPRRSFGAKLIVALLVTVGLMLAVMHLVVRSETQGQVALVTARAVERAHEAFEESEARRREQMAQRARVFTDTRRKAALLEAAIDAKDTAFLENEIAYSLLLTPFDSSLTALTGPRGEPILSFLGPRPMRKADPARIEPLAAELLSTFDPELIAYRVVEGQLYTVRVVLLDLAGRVVGAMGFGLPIEDGDAAGLASLVGAEVCFVAGGRCVAGSERAREGLAPEMAAMPRGAEARVLEADGERWVLVRQPLTEDRPDDGSLVMAVPLEAVLSPFERISRALGFASAAALLLAIVISVVLSRGLTRPVRQLVGATVRVARGDYETRVPERSADEMGQLARAFNEMTSGLALKEQYRGVLDKVVSKDVAEELLRGELRLGGENREVTVLFADVRGFTTLTEGMEPQRVIGVLNETMERLGTAVEEAGGVVDKYVGDEIMAVFGAPFDQPDHADRAMSAAVAMQRAMTAMNDGRSGRVAPRIEIGIGVHSGVAVAGNMGSPNRLNYTVLGETVNLASRLCSVAGPGEVLLSEATHGWLRQPVRTAGTRALELKGFSRSVSVRVMGAAEWSEDRHGAVAGGAGSRGALMSLAAIGLASLACGIAGVGAPASAQSLPTLSDLGLGYISPDGFLQLDLSGRLDLEGFAPGREAAWIIPTTEPFLAARARLLADAFVGSRVYAAAELRVDRGEEPTAGPWDARMDQAFVRVRAFGPLSVQAGKFVSPFGGWPQRHHTTRDDFIRPPLSYDYRTVISPTIAPADGPAFVDWKDGVPMDFRPRGSPPVWGAPYQWGGMVLGAVGRGSVRLGMMNSAPSSEPAVWGWDADRFQHPSLVANVGLQLNPALRLEGSWNRGPYLEPPIDGSPDPGWEWHEYLQEIFGFEAVYAAGAGVLRGEILADRWEVPNVPDDAWDLSYYVEGQMDVATGAYLAARWGEIRFNELGPGGGYGGAGQDPRWDYDVRRIQIAGGYRVVRNAGVRAEYMLNHTDHPSGDPSDNLFSVQAWWQY